MIGKAFAVVIAGFAFIAPGFADDAMPDNNGGRFTFSKVPEGILRLDRQSGAVSLCSQRTVGWACQAMPDDRAVLEDEIARLRRENGALKNDLLARGLPLPDAPGAAPPAAHDGAPSPYSDLDRMMAYVDRLWRRLVEAIARAQRQMMNKS
jgi:hypothetical protein